MSRIVVDDVSRVYGETVTALRHVSLTVGRGELVAIVGPSGSGKSTLLHILGTLERPTSGTVTIDGQGTAGLTDRELAGLRGASIGFVFQQFHLLTGLTAGENVEQALLYSGVPRRERRSRALEALSRLGLADRALHRPGELSGGEQQRVAIARAVVKDPSIVLADEPTGNLDSATGQRILESLLELGRGGTTVVMITHDREVAAAFPRQVEVRDGAIVRDAR